MSTNQPFTEKVPTGQIKKAKFRFTSPLLLLLSLVLLILLSGCGTNGAVSIDAATPGLFNHYIIFPLSWLLHQMAAWFTGNYGLAIITLTISIRLLLLPLMLSQSKTQWKSRSKMALMKPELDRLQEKYKKIDKKQDPEAGMRQQQEMMELYKQHSFNPLSSMGCLPLLLQFPILTGLYYAIRLTPELATHPFLWFQLGQPNMVLALVAALISYLQFRLSQQNMEPTNSKQMAFIGLLSPVMMGLFSLGAPAALPLYWITGGCFLILQNLLTNRLYRKNSSL